MIPLSLGREGLKSAPETHGGHADISPGCTLGTCVCRPAVITYIHVYIVTYRCVDIYTYIDIHIYPLSTPSQPRCTRHSPHNWNTQTLQIDNWNTQIVPIEYRMPHKHYKFTTKTPIYDTNTCHTNATNLRELKSLLGLEWSNCVATFDEGKAVVSIS